MILNNFSEKAPQFSEIMAFTNFIFLRRFWDNLQIIVVIGKDYYTWPLFRRQRRSDEWSEFEPTKQFISAGERFIRLKNISNEQSNDCQSIADNRKDRTIRPSNRAEQFQSIRAELRFSRRITFSFHSGTLSTTFTRNKRICRIFSSVTIKSESIHSFKQMTAISLY